MRLRADRFHVTADVSAGHVRFSVPDTGTAFLRLIVAARSGEVLWDLVPDDMDDGTSDVTVGRFVGIDGGGLIGKVIEKVFSPRDPGGEALQSGPRKDIHYGEVPEGYAETMSAKPLSHGAVYKVFVLAEGRTGRAEFVYVDEK